MKGRLNGLLLSIVMMTTGCVLIGIGPDKQCPIRFECVQTPTDFDPSRTAASFRSGRSA